jgi:predicted  nucleic acid-binding Zn-ribbon protein
MKEEMYSNLSNMELKLKMKTLENEYEAIKNKIIALCEDLEEIEANFNKAKHELEIRSNFF